MAAQKIRSRRAAFTLLETLIAILLFAGGVVVIIGIFGTTLAASIDSEMTAVAMNLAQKRLEELRNLDFDTGIVSEAKTVVQGFPQFQRSVDVTTPYTDLKQVTVDVYWSYKGGETDTSITTYISKN